MIRKIVNCTVQALPVLAAIGSIICILPTNLQILIKSIQRYDFDLKKICRNTSNSMTASCVVSAPGGGAETPEVHCLCPGSVHYILLSPQQPLCLHFLSFFCLNIQQSLFPC